MTRVLAAAILTLGLVGGAMAQTGGGTGTNGGTTNGGTTNGGTTNGGTNAGDTNGAANGTGTTTDQTDQSGAPDKCKNAADGATTTEGATTKQEAQNCP
ncbi:hypothetical protein [Mesorhizobium sp.]|jgi:hypothetical protein|uniref:hypothetical protein n=1 Tax=Mesorhizobium sp. TaxID=1871066 RepID=UPI003569C037